MACQELFSVLCSIFVAPWLFRTMVVVINVFAGDTYLSESILCCRIDSI